jgi:chromosome segregation ATPase
MRSSALIWRWLPKVSDLRSKLAETQGHRRSVAASIKHQEERLDNTELLPASRKEVQQWISGKKSELESLAAEEQQRQSAEMEAEEQLRVEQAKLGGLEDRIDRLEKELDNPH